LNGTGVRFVSHLVRTPGLLARATLLLAPLALIALAFGAPSAEAKPARSLPARYAKAPYSKMSLSVGHPNAGYQVRAKKLKKGPGLEILPKSRDRVYGHPSLVLMLQRSAKQIARSFPGSTLTVGDLSFAGGGPLVGHASHQSGRDADVLFYVRDAKGRIAKTPGFISFGGDGKARDGSGLVFDDERNWQLVQAWARDHRAGSPTCSSRARCARGCSLGAANTRRKTTSRRSRRCSCSPTTPSRTTTTTTCASAARPTKTTSARSRAAESR
jgi:hypothetical protein